MRKVTAQRLAEFTERDYVLTFGVGKREFDRMLAALEDAYRREHKRKPRFTKITMLDKLVLTYQNTSSTAVRVSIAPKDETVPILTDIRRTSIYGGGSIEVQNNDNTTVSKSLVLDSIMYSQSQEEHSMKIRQQDPTTKLWSLCEVHSFISNGGARASVWVQWSEINVSYSAPTV